MTPEPQTVHPRLRVASAIVPMPADARRSEIGTASIVISLVGLALAIANYIF